ncbi:hypothetical protein [Mesorhizobium delmotii]|uniref:Uncharacterized protein n=1 Tax=Mesorhizobium delmotii TaxID=1631247 RepID=A0A2P9APD5_9HYPH|nr:hypothetical protein [Mesorhizobium delmotii]SJM33015.1 hypothetical protein BQ8482_330150 [Mesorhizobium delmotii]
MASKPKAKTSPHGTVQDLIKAVGGADGITLVEVSRMMRTLTERAEHFKRRSLDGPRDLVLGEMRVLEGMVPRLIASHPPIAGWERDKVYKRGDLIVAEGCVWKLTNGTGDKRQDWETIFGQTGQPASKPLEVDEEIGELLKDLVGLDGEEAAIERRAIERYRAAVKESGITAAQLDAPMTFRTQLRSDAGVIEHLIDALRKRDERIEKIETDLKRRGDELQERLVEVAKTAASAVAAAVDRLAEVEVRAAKLESEPFDIDETIEDGGRIVVRRFMRNGELISEKRHVTAAMIYRGIYSEKTFYLPGDVVTKAGSMWICRAECTGIFNGDFWVLAVKKGRDGANHD